MTWGVIDSKTYSLILLFLFSIKIVHAQRPMKNGTNKLTPYINPWRKAKNIIPETRRIRSAENKYIVFIILLGFLIPRSFIEIHCNHPSDIPVITPAIAQAMQIIIEYFI